MQRHDLSYTGMQWRYAARNSRGNVHFLFHFHFAAMIKHSTSIGNTNVSIQCYKIQRYDFR